MTKQVGDSQLIDTWAATGPIVDPDVAKKDEGWQLGEQPPHEWMNWLQNTFGQKINHILKNGVPDWNADTEYTDAVVRHNGSVWLAVAANTNSEPSAISANWVRVATADNAVLLTGNQTIAGVKTFSSSPVIPDASNNNHPVALGQFTQSLTTNGYQLLPSGLIIQWGRQTLTNNSVITFPTSFTTELYVVNISGAKGGVVNIAAADNYTLTGFNGYLYTNTGAGTTNTVSWQAIGY